MIWTWVVGAEAGRTVTLEATALGLETVRVDGETVSRRRNFGLRTAHRFVLPEGRAGEIVASSFLLLDCTLSIDGQEVAAASRPRLRWVYTFLNLALPLGLLLLVGWNSAPLWLPAPELPARAFGRGDTFYVADSGIESVLLHLGDNGRYETIVRMHLAIVELDRGVWRRSSPGDIELRSDKSGRVSWASASLTDGAAHLVGRGKAFLAGEKRLVGIDARTYSRLAGTGQPMHW